MNRELDTLMMDFKQTQKEISTKDKQIEELDSKIDLLILQEIKTNKLFSESYLTLSQNNSNPSDVIFTGYWSKFSKLCEFLGKYEKLGNYHFGYTIYTDRKDFKPILEIRGDDGDLTIIFYDTTLPIVLKDYSIKIDMKSYDKDIHYHNESIKGLQKDIEKHKISINTIESLKKSIIQ
jgi:hypothetical protein